MSKLCLIFLCLLMVTGCDSDTKSLGEIIDEACETSAGITMEFYVNPFWKSGTFNCFVPTEHESTNDLPDHITR